MLQRMGDYCIDRTDELEHQNKEKMDKLKEETTNIDQYKNLFDLLDRGDKKDTYLYRKKIRMSKHTTTNKEIPRKQ